MTSTTKPAHTPTPWAQSDMNPCLVFRDSQGVIDMSAPVAQFKNAADARLACDATEVYGAHADLIAAAKAVVVNALDIDGNDQRASISYEHLNDLQAALQQAEKGE